MARGSKKPAKNGGPLDFKEKLWEAADKLRGHMDPGEYKHVVLGLIFLKYISDAFQELHDKLSATAATEHTDPEDRDEYLAENVFWVPQKARWAELQAKAKTPEIGRLLDDAMLAIEKDNQSLRGVLPKIYASPDLNKERLGEVLDLIGTVGLGDPESRRMDVLGRVYEYFIGKFASQEGKAGGEFYTAACVVRLLVEMLEPFHGRIYDPCCGSGGMFVQSERFVETHGGRRTDVAVYGQESNPTTWRLARMNLAIRGIDANLGPHHGDSFHHDLHPDLKADFILANPPFNDSDWGGERVQNDPRWKYGAPPPNNANFAWVQHFLHHLAPNGTAGFVLANGSMSSTFSGEGDIRRQIIEADLVDCMVSLPGQLFYTTPIPVCLWFLARDKRNSGKRDRRGETLFIDAHRMGAMVDRVHRELTDDDVAAIARCYHAWRGEPKAGRYEDVAAFCRSATIQEIAQYGFLLTPGRYVGAEEVEDQSEPFAQVMTHLTAQLWHRMDEAGRLDLTITRSLGSLGYGRSQPSTEHLGEAGGRAAGTRVENSGADNG
ncbi:MAG: class I SAM-dependent DNA methyltransferase [Armatimonadia bacterium]